MMTDSDESPVLESPLTPDELGCPVPMHSNRRCGRPPYRAVYPGDRENVCLMHTHDPGKDQKEFQSEFERTLELAGDGVADFSYFLFPAAAYGQREFRAECLFSWATFWGDTLFYKARFARSASFAGCKFNDAAAFWKTAFHGDALFRGAQFTAGVEFTEAAFEGDAYFSRAKFASSGRFWKAHFLGKALFGGCEFEDVADFGGASFAGEARFTNASFRHLANFSTAEFGDTALFMEATFDGDASFWLTEFARLADFHHARFAGAAEFRETRISDGASTDPAPVFVLAYCEKPERIVFYKTYLGRALFHNCDVSRFHFSNVKWREDPTTHKNTVYEQVVNVQEQSAAALRVGDEWRDERNFTLVAELYQQLKKNYDDRRDYWTAGDFHYGEMEMKRLHSPTRKRWVRWLHRNLGLVALYRHTSEYGESYSRPAAWLAFLLVLFSVLYPLFGLRQARGTFELSYAQYIRYGKGDPTREWLGPATHLGNSMVTTLSVAALQRDLTYEPIYPWGRLLALFELLLTSTLIALFLLAIRRQFRR